MAAAKLPATSAIRMLKAHHVAFDICPYRYEDQGGTEVAAKELGVDEYRVIKTLVMETDQRLPLIVLMHGNKQVSTKALARELEVKTVTPCDPAVAHKHTGYQVGGISPFGTRKALPVYVEESILDLPEIFINGGKRGLLVKIAPQDLQTILRPMAVNVTRD